MATPKRKYLVCVAGKTGQGKSASLRNMADEKRVLYINCESGKELPFPHKFKQVVLTEPTEIFDIIADAEESGKFDTVVVDSLTFLMEMYESRHVYKSKDGFGAWADFQQYAKELFTDVVPNSAMSFIFTAHAETKFNEELGYEETFIPVKGSLGKNGLEAYFSVIVLATVMPVPKLRKSKSELLVITEDEEIDGIKHVFQTRRTKETIGARVIRGPIGLWTRDDTFIDNDAQMLIDVVNEFLEG